MLEEYFGVRLSHRHTMNHLVSPRRVFLGALCEHFIDRLPCRETPITQCTLTVGIDTVKCYPMRL